MPTDPLGKPSEAIAAVYRYVAYRIGAGPDAEDITSETLERAIRYRGSFDPRKGSAKSWLIGIASNAIADWRLKRPNSWTQLTEEQASGESDPADVLSTQEEVRRAVAQLDERARELIALRYGADLKAKEIGRLQGMTAAAVEVALHRANQKLRAILAGDARREPESGDASVKRATA